MREISKSKLEGPDDEIVIDINSHVSGFVATTFNVMVSTHREYCNNLYLGEIISLHQEVANFNLIQINSHEKILSEKEERLVARERSFKNKVDSETALSKKIEQLKDTKDSLEKLLKIQKEEWEKQKKNFLEEKNRENTKFKKQIKTKDKKIHELEGRLALLESKTKLHGTGLSILIPVESSCTQKPETSSTRGRASARNPGINIRSIWRSMPIRRSKDHRYIHDPEESIFVENFKLSIIDNIEFRSDSIDY